jgi:NADH-quinone oxidoreductase subunit G
MIDVCPVGALTDKTFRFKSRVWFNKPYCTQRL